MHLIGEGAARSLHIQGGIRGAQKPKQDTAPNKAEAGERRQQAQQGTAANRRAQTQPHAPKQASRAGTQGEGVGVNAYPVKEVMENMDECIRCDCTVHKCCMQQATLNGNAGNHDLLSIGKYKGRLIYVGFCS